MAFGGGWLLGAAFEAGFGGDVVLASANDVELLAAIKFLEDTSLYFGTEISPIFDMSVSPGFLSLLLFTSPSLTQALRSSPSIFSSSMRTMRSKAKRAARVFNNRVAVGNSSAISYNVSASIEYVSANVKHRAVFAVF